MSASYSYCKAISPVAVLHSLCPFLRPLLIRTLFCFCQQVFFILFFAPQPSAASFLDLNRLTSFAEFLRLPFAPRDIPGNLDLPRYLPIAVYQHTLSPTLVRGGLSGAVNAGPVNVARFLVACDYAVCLLNILVFLLLVFIFHINIQ